MTSFVSHTSIDCHNAFDLSEFWKQVLGYVDIDDDPNEPGHEECMILDPESGHRLLFIEVPEGKTAKNRIHLDLRPRESSRDAELTRLLDHGAALIADRRSDHGLGWAVLADPEGNEFCILRSEDELRQQITLD